MRNPHTFLMVLVLFVVISAFCLVGGCLCPTPPNPPVCPPPVTCPPTTVCPTTATPSGGSPDFGRTIFFDVKAEPYEVQGYDVVKYRAIINPDHSFTLKELTIGDFVGTWQPDTASPVLRIKFNVVSNSISPHAKTGTIEFYSQNRASIFTPSDGFWTGYQATGKWYY